MICCLNPNCARPENPDSGKVCLSCGTLLIQQLRGRYRPVKVIGRGGFGRTYLATDTDRLNTYCVVKQFAPQTQGTKSFNKAVQLFEQEALRLNELGEHPQIPTLLAYFEHEQYLYLVQQMVEGRTLYQEVQKTGPYNESAIRALLNDLLPVLQFIHEQGVIHRDITPTNVIRRKVDSKPVLIDFGVAKQFSETILYEPGTRIGTEGFAPIEQLRSGQAYPSSDLYSLGATCLHLITGCKPESLYNPLEGRWMWREKLQQIGRSCHPELGNLLDRLVKDLVSERFQSAGEVIAELRRIPSLEGAVPGWVSQGSASSRLPSGGSLPLGKERKISIPPMPTTKPPKMSVPSLSQPRLTKPPGPLSGLSGPGRSGLVSGTKGTGWQCVRELTGHSSWVTAVDFNPKTPTLVSGSLDDTLKIWNLQSGQVFYSLEGHARGVNEVKVSAGGQVLASCGDDDVVKVWNLAEGALLYVLKGHLRDVTSIAIGAKGFLLASGSEDMTIKLWKLDKGSLLKTLTGSSGMVKTVAMTSDEGTLVSGGLDNKVRVWEVGTARQVRVLSGHMNTVNQVAISRDNRLLASASKDRTIRLWSLRSGSLIHTLSDHTQEVNGVAIAADNRTLVSGSSDGTLKVWDTQTGQLKYTLTGHTNSVLGVAFHPNGRVIASASADKTIRVWRWAG
ncbi:MAG: serine/threonine protein kinase [Cyanobacteria bacterium Co-bin8]|nr:serine/threonine protein kinase [Cyanobacteria bacterium Co-bin8]